MMNPQYPPPGNNNAPNNPLGFPPSQDHNGVHNANIYSQMPLNGPQMDMSQKMQNINLNGPQSLSNIPPSQLPPGQFPSSNFPPTSNYSGQLPPGVNPPSQPGRPPVSNNQQIPAINHNYVPPSSTPGPTQPGHQPPISMQGPPTSMGRSGPPEPSRQGMPTQIGAPQGFQGQPSSSQPGMPPPPGPAQTGGPGQFGLKPGSGQITSLPPQLQGPANSQPSIQPNPLQPGQQSGVPPQTHQKSFFGQSGLPPQPGISQSGIQSQAGFPPQHSMPQQPGIPPQQSAPKHSQPGMILQPSLQPGMPPKQGMPPPSGMTQHSGMPPQPGMPLQPGMTSQPAMPSQPVMPPQSSMPPQPVMPHRPGNQPHPGIQPQHGVPPQPGLPSQQGMPLQPGMPPQPSMTPQQVMPPQSGMPQQQVMPPQSGMPPQQVMPPQSGMPPQQVMPSQSGIPPQPGMPPQQVMPPQPGMPPQPNIQPQPSQFNQYQPMTGLPHMPPPLNQQMQYQQPGYGAQPGPQANVQYGGMPPQQGYQQGYQFPAQQPSYAAPPQKRLDPDQMPSPIQVMQDDQQNRGGVFVTNDKGLVPPLVTTDFVVDDKGNSSPRYIRSSMYSVPVTMDLLKQTAMPFCLVISPMAETVGTEQEPPLLDFAALTGSPTMGPVRCCRCKAYMCPNMKFIDGGRHFKCAFCKATSEVPMEYTQYISSMQQYGRAPAEMALGTYEIVATKEYCRNNTLPSAPAVVFVIDVSYNSVKSGLLQTVCDNILDIIESMPKDEQTGKCCTRVGFITYSTTVQFYNIKGSLAQPQMLSVGDTADMFVPLLEGFLQCAEDSGPVLRALLALLPTACRAATDTETVLLPAVQAGYEALKAADTAGQLLVFHTSLPTYNAPGKLINREDRKVLGTDKEKQILSPQSTAYNELGQLCSAAGVCVQLFLCNNSYIDCATLGQLPRLTGGQVYKYTYFTAETDGRRLAWDVSRVLLRPTAHDAVMRVRTSTGVRATDFYGHFFMSNTTDVELAAIDSDKAIGVEIKHDDKLTGEQGVFVQAALLYTHRSGQRRLRVLNLALALAQQLADVYRSAELDTMVNFLTKQAVWALREAPPRAVREGLTARCARSLAAYRRHCASPSSSGQLVLPEAMKLLPLYTSCVLRGDAVAGGPDITCDDRSCAMYRALTADVSQSLVYTYPRLLALHTLPEREPQPLRASMDKMSDQGVYLLENGVHMLIWVGSQAPADFVRDVFGVSSPQAVDARVCELPETDTRAGAAVRRLLEDARRTRRNAMRLSVVPQHDKLEYEFRRMLVEDKGPNGAESYVEHLMTTHKLLTVMRQHDKLETVLRQLLVEDRGLDGGASYVDYLCHIHKEIRALL